MPQSITVSVSKKILTDFHKTAKKFFPVECFCFLLGTIEQEKIKITEIFYPKGFEEFCSLTVIGDWHSHPWKHSELKQHNNASVDAAPSQTDWENVQGIVTGICLIIEMKNHKLRAKSTFWGPLTPLILKKYE